MHEVTIVSGKGGTGKTSVTAALATLAERPVIVDCDVEAPDLNLLLDPQLQHTEDFVGGEVARLHTDLCTGCGRCAAVCRYDAVRVFDLPTRYSDKSYTIDTNACEGCRACAEVCPSQAITMEPHVVGQWHRSHTLRGPFVHARLRPGAGNSGKLVSLLRKLAREHAEAHRRDLLICDGVPGVGCPVIASIGGADLALLVAEPGVSALHDLKRILELARHFNVPAVLCINKWNVAPDLTQQIEDFAAGANVAVLGRIPYDKSMIDAQIRGRSAIEHGDGPAADALRALWEALQPHLRPAAALS